MTILDTLVDSDWRAPHPHIGRAVHTPALSFMHGGRTECLRAPRYGQCGAIALLRHAGGALWPINALCAGATLNLRLQTADAKSFAAGKEQNLN